MNPHGVTTQKNNIVNWKQSILYTLKEKSIGWNKAKTQASDLKKLSSLQYPPIIKHKKTK
jgi:hypothetical protein